MRILRPLAQFPLLTAALVAICGVALIVFSRVWPEPGDEAETERAEYERVRRQSLAALVALKSAGVVGNVEVKDFTDGLGLAVTGKGLEAGAVVMTVPEALALDVRRTRSCPSDQVVSSPAESTAAASSEVACRVERLVAHAVESKEVTRLIGFIVLLILDKRRGIVDGLTPTVGAAVLSVLPGLRWQEEHGIFAIDADEFRVMSHGTSMEGWRDTAIAKTEEAHAFIKAAGAGSLEADLGGDVGLNEVRWAYLVLHAYGQWAEEQGADDGAEPPAEVRFLWPLFLSRPTAEFNHGVSIRRSEAAGGYEVVVPRAMHAGEEVLFVDRRLCDATALCFRGLWLMSRHRARLDLNVTVSHRDPKSQPILQKFGCGGQPLRLYVEGQAAVDPQFLSCMRLLALAGNATKLKLTVERLGWEKVWPHTHSLGHKVEAAAAEIAVAALQQALNRLASSSAELRERFGNDPVGARPTVRVREAETMVIAGLLKSMKELQLLSSNEYLYDALRDAQEAFAQQRN